MICSVILFRFNETRTGGKEQCAFSEPESGEKETMLAHEDRNPKRERERLQQRKRQNTKDPKRKRDIDEAKKGEKLKNKKGRTKERGRKR